jgi:plasmid stabilization system protein ParE
MKRRYILAPAAALDLVQIWTYIRAKTSLPMADRVESAIRNKIVFLAATPSGGHLRRDLTDERRTILFDLLVSDCLPARDETSAGRCYSPRQ